MSECAPPPEETHEPDSTTQRQPFAEGSTRKCSATRVTMETYAHALDPAKAQVVQASAKLFGARLRNARLPVGRRLWGYP